MNDDPILAKNLQNTYSVWLQDALDGVITELADNNRLPLKANYTEAEACVFFGKGEQFFSTRRANGQSVPKPLNIGGGNLYTMMELLRWQEEIGPDVEESSKAMSIERGLETFSQTIDKVQRKIADLKPKSRL